MTPNRLNNNLKKVDTHKSTVYSKFIALNRLFQFKN